MSSIGQGSISIDESTRIGENAQDTANEVAGNVNDINSDNKLTPSEKIKLKQEYDKDLKLYTIDTSQLQSADLPTTELETAMNNLTAFITPLFKEMNRTSTVDRGALDSVFTAFATADKNASQAFVNKVQQVADDAKKAGDDAKQAGEEAQELGQEAKKSAEQAQTDATQAKADASTAQQKAQSSIDQLNEATKKFDGEITNVKNSAQKALDNITVVDSRVDELSDSTTAQFNTLNNGYQEVISTVNNMDIGGRNIVLDSNNMESFRIWKVDGDSKLSDDKKEITVTTSHGGIDIGKKNLSEYLPNKGDTIMISADVKGNSHLQFNYNDGNSFVGQGTNIAVTTEYKRYFTTFEWNPVNLDETEFAIFATGSAEQYLTIKNVKIEIGNKVTDWSPAPEDFASQTQITALSNLIDQKVSNDQYQSDKTQTADLIASKVATKDFSAYQDMTAKEFSSTIEAVQTQVQDSAVGTNLVKDSEQEFTGKAYDFHDYNLASLTELTPGETYTMSFSSKVDDKAINCQQQVFIDISNPSWSYEKRNYVPSSTDYQRVTYTFTIPEGQTGVAVISVYLTHPVINGNPDPSSDKSDVAGTGYVKEFKLEKGSHATDYSVSPKDIATQSQITQLSGEIEQKVDSGDFSTYKTQTADLIESRVDNGTYQSDKTQTADLISQTVKKNDVVNQINVSTEGILIDGKKVHITGNTSIDNAVIKNSMIANAAINTAQIANGAINNAKIANAAIDDAKISNLDGNKIIAGSIAASKIDVNDLIANGINTKTLTSVNLNTSTLTTPQLNLGLNGTFTEDFDYTQPTSMFLPKKNKGTLTFNHGVLQSKGDMQTYVDGKWGGMNDNYTFQAGLDNSQWTEVAPGYIKFDLFKQNDTDVLERTYIDPTGYYYTSRNGTASYLGNALQTSQVQAPSVFTKYIGPVDGKSHIQIGNNGDHYGLQVGFYAGNEAVLSDFIYNSTTSGAANVNITSNGHLVRSTSASKYKYNIKNPDIETTLGDRLLNVHLATWNDKRAVDSYAEQLNTGEEREKSSIDKYYGLIAEQLRDAGLDMFISYGKNHEIEGIQYDRAWIPLLSVIRRLNDKVNEYELRLSKLEGANK